MNIEAYILGASLLGMVAYSIRYFTDWLEAKTNFINEQAKSIANDKEVVNEDPDDDLDKYPYEEPKAIANIGYGSLASHLDPLHHRLTEDSLGIPAVRYINLPTKIIEVKIYSNGLLKVSQSIDGSAFIGSLEIKHTLDFINQISTKYMEIPNETAITIVNESTGEVLKGRMKK